MPRHRQGHDQGCWESHGAKNKGRSTGRGGRASDAVCREGGKPRKWVPRRRRRAGGLVAVDCRQQDASGSTQSHKFPRRFYGDSESIRQWQSCRPPCISALNQSTRFRCPSKKLINVLHPLQTMSCTAPRPCRAARPHGYRDREEGAATAAGTCSRGCWEVERGLWRRRRRAAAPAAAAAGRGMARSPARGHCRGGACLVAATQTTAGQPPRCLPGDASGGGRSGGGGAAGQGASGAPLPPPRVLAGDGGCSRHDGVATGGGRRRWHRWRAGALLAAPAGCAPITNKDGLSPAS